MSVRARSHACRSSSTARRSTPPAPPPSAPVTVTQRANLPDQVELVVADGAAGGLQPGATLRLDVEGQTRAAVHRRGRRRRAGLRTRTAARTTTGARLRRPAPLAPAPRRRRPRARHDGGAGEGRGAPSSGWHRQVAADGPELGRVVQRRRVGARRAAGAVGAHRRRCSTCASARCTCSAPTASARRCALRWGTTLREARLDATPRAAARPVRVAAWDPAVGVDVLGRASRDGRGAARSPAPSPARADEAAGAGPRPRRPPGPRGHRAVGGRRRRPRLRPGHGRRRSTATTPCAAATS